MQKLQSYLKVRKMSDYSDPVTLSDIELSADKVQSEFCSLLNVDLEEIDRLAENYAQLDAEGDAGAKIWLNAYLSGLSHLMKGNALSDSVNRASSTWKQALMHEGDKLGISKVKYGSSSSGIISGDKALMKLSGSLGLGTTVQVPLWHTGIWVTLKAPTESSLLELDRRISNEKITLGRYTSGMAFSHTSVYTVGYVLNFILNHVIDSSLKGFNNDSLKSLIKVTDIPSLVNGILSSIYPSGYDYARPCTTNPTECQHVTTGKVSIPKLMWVDNSAITPTQAKHMSKRDSKFTVEEIKKYQDEHVRGDKRTVSISDNLNMVLNVPTLEQYIESGTRWVDNIVRLLEVSLGTSLDSKERDDYILAQGKLTTVRQYGHWISEIVIDDDIVKDTDTIESALSLISADEELTDKIFTELGIYIDDSVISLMAVPKYKCPKCQGEEEVSLENFPHLLPIDAIRSFFTLLDQRMVMAMSVRKLTV